MHELLKAWRNWKCDDSPFLLSGDEALQPRPDSRVSVAHRSWRTFIGEETFGRREDRRFHLDLIPVPFTGDLQHAKIVVLLLNPGLDPADYFAEFKVSGFRERLIKNLHQDFRNVEYPFLYLDPDISWHSGYRWWHGKFQALIGEIAKSRHSSYAEARHYLSTVLACVELVPYHSRSWPGISPEGLRSARLAQNYVHNILVPRSRTGNVLIAVTRKTRIWKLRSSKNIVVYSNSQTRAAHLTPDSQGGRAILKFLNASH